MSGKIDKSFGDPSKSERDKYLETLMADMGLLDIRELSKKEQKAFIEAAKPTYMMKKRKKKLAKLLKISQEDLYVYHAAPSSVRKSINEHGILSSKAMLDMPEILGEVADSKGVTSDWLKERIEKNLNDEDWKKKESNPSVFFSKPDWSKLGDEHPLVKTKHDLYRVNLTKLLNEVEGSGLWGVELEPYSGSGPYHERKLSIEDAKELSERGAKELWKDFKSIDNYYAVDVPHAFVMSGGAIPREYVEYMGPMNKDVSPKIAKRKQLELPFPELDFSLPDSLLSGPSDPILVKNIPFEKITMRKKQGDSILRDLRMNRPSMTEGLPELFWDTEHNQLIVEDGNHRIFQAYLDGDRTFDAMVSSGDYNNLYSPVYEGEERFDWGLFPNQEIFEDGRAYKIAKFLKYSKEMDTKNVRPNDIITVYHGTSLADCYEMINGFDANKVKARLYGGPKHAGIFVAPNEEEAGKFAHYGEIILEIDVRAKFLHGVDYSGNIGRSSDPHVDNIEWHEQEMEARNDFAKSKFPDSFRPTLSKTWTQKNEPQALLRGLVSPNQIKRVRYKEYGKDPIWYSREDFIKLGAEVIPRSKQPYGDERKFRDIGYDLSSTSHSDADFTNMMAKSLDASPEKVEKMINFYSDLRRRNPDRSDSLLDLFDRAGIGDTASRAYSKKYSSKRNRLLELKKIALMVHGKGDMVVGYEGNVWLFESKDLDTPLEEDEILNINKSLKTDWDWDTPDELIDSINEGGRPDILLGRIYEDGYKILNLTNYSGFQIDPKSSPLVKKIVNQLNIDTVEYSSFAIDESFEIDSTHSIGDIQGVMYHGTTTKYLREILLKGLMPGVSESNFRNISHENFVFITSMFDKAQFHAINAATLKGGDPMIIELRIPDKNQLVQDYDVDNQSEVSDLYKNIPHSIRRSKYDTTEMPGNAFRLSKEFGIFGYRGRIPSSNIISYHIAPNVSDYYSKEDLYNLESVNYEEVMPEQARVYLETKEDYGIGQFEEPEFIDEGLVDGSASGLFITDGSRVLLLERSSWVQDPGLWGIPGGAIPINSITGEERDSEESAFAEAEEEIGGVPAGQVVGENIYQDGDFTYTTYIYKTSPDELESFEPTLNSEHTDYMLHTIGDDTSGIHPGVIEVINGLKKEAYTMKSIYGIIKNNAK